MTRIVPIVTAALLVACTEPGTAEITVPTSSETIETPATEPSQDPCGALPPGPQVLPVRGFEDRPTWVNIPEGDGPRDAVVVLHAAGGDRDSVARLTRFHRRAEERGMVAVYPSSTEGSWRSGGHEALDHLSKVDDVAYLSAVSDALAEQLCVDRVLGAGVDRGGMMVQRWACEGTGVDAIVSMAGPRLEHDCPQPPVHALLAHGLDDKRMPYDGSESPLTHRVWPSALDTTGAWLDHNGWDGGETHTRQHGPYVCETYDADARVTHCSIEGWGHGWLGGRNTQDHPEIDLTVQSLNWFEQTLDFGTL